MGYTEEIREHLQNPAGLERIYRQAVQRGEEKLFTEALESLLARDPQNLLLAAWHYRLTEEAAPRPTAGRRPLHWLWAVLLAVATGLISWWLSDPKWMIRGFLPAFPLYWAPVAAVFILLFLFVAGYRSPRRLALSAIGLALVGAFVYFASFLIRREIFWQQYLILGAIHLVPLAWISIALYVLKGQADDKSRLAFLAKSLETVVMGILFGGVLGIFTGISFGLFYTLNLPMSDSLIRLFWAGGTGCIPVLAVAAVYDPLRRMREQTFATLFRFTTLLLRFFLAPSIVVLMAYLLLIPFHFWAPFHSREALVVYNIMLFAVVGLLVWTVPVEEEGLSARAGWWLRRGRLTLVVLAELISLYALAAIIFRTWWDGFTPNRITVIGWNLINIALLAVLLVREWRAGDDGWISAPHRTFALAMSVYALWSLLLLLALPLAFH